MITRSRVLGPLGLAAWSAAILLAPGPAMAGPQKVAWTTGPATVDLGQGIAQVDLGDGYAFAGPADTRRLLAEMGNTVDNTEVGLVRPTGDDQDWLMIFEYKPEGYVKDKDKDEIDKNAILKSYQDGTEAGNKNRKEKGLPGLHVTGWFEEPHYDRHTHNLVWALQARSDDGSEVVNYNVRVLGREGYMSLTLVDEPSKLSASKPQVETILSTFSYKKGKSYAEWVPGDKVATYGLTALVAGGAGAAAVKLGLFAGLMKVLAKGGKAIAVGLAALAMGARKLFNTLRGEKTRQA
jgi:uncharacterized membrane-anchored protein